jgi:hypothetical protein
MNPTENTPYRRRRRPFGYVGTAVTTALAVYGAYHLAVWAWNTWKSSEDDEEENEQEEDHTTINNTQQNGGTTQPQQRRHVKHRVTKDPIPVVQQRRCMAQCRLQTAATLAAFHTMLFKKIEDGTDTTMVRRQLKEIRNLHSDDTKHQESILWMTIQVETVTRLLTMVYATTLLYTTLTIQVYRLGGRMYHSQNVSKPNGDDQQNISEWENHAALLHSFDTFWETDGGLDDLLELVRSAVQAALKSWNIHDPAFALHMSLAHLLSAISDVRSVVEVKGDLLQRFIVMNDSTDANNDNNTEPDASPPATATSTTAAPPTPTPTSNVLLNEIYDLLESPVANDAIRDALQCVFTILQDQYIAPIFNCNDKSNHTTGNNSNNNDSNEMEHRSNVRPLPYVISQLKVVTNSFIHSDSGSNHGDSSNGKRNGSIGSNIYVSAMERLPSIQEAARISFGVLL